MKWRLSLKESYKDLNLPKVDKLLQNELCKFAYKLVYNLLPINLAKYIWKDSKGKSVIKNHGYLTRNKNIPNLPVVTSNQYKNTFMARPISLCNNIQFNAL